MKFFVDNKMISDRIGEFHAKSVEDAIARIDVEQWDELYDGEDYSKRLA